MCNCDFLFEKVYNSVVIYMQLSVCEDVFSRCSEAEAPAA